MGRRLLPFHPRRALLHHVLSVASTAAAQHTVIVDNDAEERAHCLVNVLHARQASKQHRPSV